MLAKLRSTLTKVMDYIQGICARAQWLDSDPPPKPVEAPQQKLVLVPVPVTHWVPRHTPGTVVELRRREFKVWQDNNKLLFG